jgi:PhnB protein
MTMAVKAVKPIPDNYHTVTPYLVVPGAAKVIDFLKQTFDAKEVVRMAGPGGSVAHAEIKIGDSIVMMGEPMGPQQPMPAQLYVYVKDVDATYKKALVAGGTSVREVTDQFYGDRNGTVKDPAGNHWGIATHKEDVSPEEMKKRMAAMMQQKASD